MTEQNSKKWFGGERVRQRRFRTEGVCRKRLLVREGVGCYHVISRCVHREFMLGDVEKEVFRKLLWKQAAFSGVEVLTYCVMSNHFHLLLRVTPIESEAERERVVKEELKKGQWTREQIIREKFADSTVFLSDDELLARYANYYGSDDVPQSSYTVDELKDILEANTAESMEARRKIISRMGNLSSFMRELKQRFTLWYNGHKKQKGTMWESRYKSVLVENDAPALTKVAAYIDLNPVRAEIVDDPAAYRYCGYAEAVAGNHLAKEGMRGLFSEKAKAYRESIRSYRLILFGEGYQAKTGKRVGLVSKPTTGNRGKISAEKLREIEKTEGHLPLHEMLLYKIRYFTDGMALGKKSFIEDIFKTHAEHFPQNRQTHGKKLQGKPWDGFTSLRDLRKAVFG